MYNCMIQPTLEGPKGPQEWTPKGLGVFTIGERGKAEVMTTVESNRSSCKPRFTEI
jgi:hypothetical protein